ncbi:TPA: helix-turn-helix domain-containing protein [Pseudomonas aeruginosa]
MDFAQKLKAIRERERVTQAGFAELTGISLSTIKKYEGASFEMGYGALTKMLGHPRFKPYTLWLMTGETAPECGQVSPE